MGGHCLLQGTLSNPAASMPCLKPLLGLVAALHFSHGFYTSLSLRYSNVLKVFAEFSLMLPLPSLPPGHCISVSPSCRSQLKCCLFQRASLRPRFRAPHSVMLSRPWVSPPQPLLLSEVILCRLTMTQKQGPGLPFPCCVCSGEKCLAYSGG